MLDKAGHANAEVFVIGPRLSLSLAQAIVIGQAQHALQRLRVVTAVI
jgi:hypothetical protein